MDQPAAVTPANQVSIIPQSLLQEIATFRDECQGRYNFNSKCDTILNTIGLLVSLGIVAAGVYNKSQVAALLGGLIASIVSAQRAFPFNQRWQFYRLLDSQAENLLTEAKNGILSVDQTIATLKAMRLDFAQQIPRGSSFRSDSGANTDDATPPPAPVAQNAAGAAAGK
jgi:putative flippase GtrA